MPGAVTFEVFPHRHDEAEACMRRIAEYAKDEQMSSFAIVTRNPREFESLLQEQSRLHGLPDTIGMQPRRLLLTPVGRFAVSLYAIRPDGQLPIVREMFPALRDIAWHPIETFVERSLRRTANFIARRRPADATIERVPSGVRYELTVGGRRVDVKLGLRHVFRMGRVSWPLTDAVLHREWMLPKLEQDETDGLRLTRANGHLVFENLYKSFRWWRDAARALLKWHGLRELPNVPAYAAASDGYATYQKEAAVLVKQIETGRYPKNVGPHCR